VKGTCGWWVNIPVIICVRNAAHGAELSHEGTVCPRELHGGMEPPLGWEPLPAGGSGAGVAGHCKVIGRDRVGACDAAGIQAGRAPLLALQGITAALSAASTFLPGSFAGTLGTTLGFVGGVVLDSSGRGVVRWGWGGHRGGVFMSVIAGGVVKR
jgi:hypothetical protein